MMYLIVSLLIFGATVVLYFGLRLRRREREVEHLRERVGVSREEEWAPLQLERDDRLSAVPALDRLLKRIAISRRLELFLYQAGFGMRVGAFILLVAATGMGGYFVGIGVFHHFLHGLVFMGAACLAPFLFAGYKRSARQRQFAEEFPDALDLLVSALRAGISFSAALQIVADESPERFVRSSRSWWRSRRSASNSEKR